jgi:outer membrane biogenesis lipoprotein LolB
MIRRQLVLAVSTIAIALLSACADATGPTSNDCSLNGGTGTQCLVSK